MRLQPAAVLGMVATAVSMGIAPSASADVDVYPPYQYMLTTANVRCVVSAERVACERPGGFPGAPTNQSGGHLQVAAVNVDGAFSWDPVGIGPSNGPVIAMVNGNPYHSPHGWTLLLTTEGTRLSNDDNGHGMNISIDGNVVTPY